jgi:hypothetical protein
VSRGSHYFFEIALQLSSWGWVDPVPDPLLLRKCGSAGNRTRTLWICSQELWPLDHRGGQSPCSESNIHLTGPFTESEGLLLCSQEPITRTSSEQPTTAIQNSISSVKTCLVSSFRAPLCSFWRHFNSLHLCFKRFPQETWLRTEFNVACSEKLCFYKWTALVKTDTIRVTNIMFLDIIDLLVFI